MTEYVVGVDLGGTKVEACLMDDKRNVYHRNRKLVHASRGLDHVIDTIEEVIRVASGKRAYKAVGIGTPGVYIPQDDRIYGSPHTLEYETAGFIRRLQNRLCAPLVVENDANCLVLAEFFSSCEGKYRYVLGIIMGTGFGSGLILDNKLYRGARGGAAELGHTTIDYNGRLCQCGRRGCVEAYLSGPSLSRRFYELSGKNIGVPDIYQLYRENHPQALSLFQESFQLLGEILANAVNTFDLEAIILGGGVSNIPLWYEHVPEYLGIDLFGIPRANIPLVPAKLGDSAGVLGAAYLALRQIGAIYF